MALGGRFTLAAPDLRGRARSADLPGPGGLERHAGDVAAFIEAVTAGPVVLVGHGYGAWVAARVAGRPFDACAGLVLVDPMPDLAAPAPFPSSVDVAFGAGLRRLGRTYPNRDAYLAEWGAHPAFRLGVDRLTRRALLADLHGSGFLWRPSVDADLVAADAQEVVAARDPTPGTSRLPASPWSCSAPPPSRAPITRRWCSAMPGPGRGGGGRRAAARGRVRRDHASPRASDP